MFGTNSGANNVWIMSDKISIFFPDPSHVIGLYPNLLPQDFRNQLEYPDRLPELEGGELEKGLLALIEFLTQVLIVNRKLRFILFLYIQKKIHIHFYVPFSTETQRTTDGHEQGNDFLCNC